MNDSIKGTYAFYNSSGYRQVLKFDSIGNFINMDRDASLSMLDSIGIYSIRGHSDNFTLTLSWYDIGMVIGEMDRIYSNCQLTIKGDIIVYGYIDYDFSLTPIFIRL